MKEMVLSLQLARRKWQRKSMGSDGARDDGDDPRTYNKWKSMVFVGYLDFTYRQVADAKEEFLRLQREDDAAWRAKLVANADGDGGENDDVPPALRIVVAHNVTQEMYDRIPEEWLLGWEVELLLPEGVLVITGKETYEKRQAKHEMDRLLKQYAQHHNCRAPMRWPIKIQGKTYTPDLMLYRDPRVPPGDRNKPIAIVSIEVNHPTLDVLAKRAALYFKLPTVQRVVGLLFFRARVSSQALVRKAALAVVFARRQSQQQERVRIVAAKSFGNAPLAPRALRSLSQQLPWQRQNASSVAPLLQPPPYSEVPIHASFVRGDFDALGQFAPYELHVELDEMGGLLPPLALDLLQIFQETLWGWMEDNASLQNP